MEIESYKQLFYLKMNDQTKLKKDFEFALNKYLHFHLPEAEDNSFFCKIHNNFKDGHNCVACNLNHTNQRIINFLLGFKTFEDTHTTFSLFIMILYLQVECIFEYIEIISLPEPYILKNFQTLFKIKRWANFLKHPKSFLLVHHPEWRYEGDNLGIIDENEIQINSKFVNQFYSGNSKNKELFKLLNKKEDIPVVFPNPIILIEEYCNAQEKFSKLISKNSIVREVLEDIASISSHFESENEDLK
jgi:hypothetical protein